MVIDLKELPARGTLNTVDVCVCVPTIWLMPVALSANRDLVDKLIVVQRFKNSVSFNVIRMLFIVSQINPLNPLTYWVPYSGFPIIITYAYII
jgi:hypothetical protein